MRSLPDYVVTKDEVHGYANHWLSTALKLECEGTKCTAGTLLQVLPEIAKLERRLNRSLGAMLTKGR